jgi:ligand-binding SRPBCC domain-containing protein
MRELQIISSDIPGNFQKVYSKFDKKLFEYILPSFPPTKLIKFEGSKKGDTVELSLGGQRWISIITEDKIEEKNAYFVDEGLKLPFPLKRWYHKHIVEYQEQNKCRIIDKIQFTTGWKALDLIFGYLLKFQFQQRTPLYRKYFDQIQ